MEIPRYRAHRVNHGERVARRHDEPENDGPEDDDALHLRKDA